MALDLEAVIEQAKMLMLEFGSVGSTVFGESEDEENCFMMNVGFKDDEEKNMFFTKVLPTVTIKKNLNEVTIVTEAYFYEATKDQITEDGSVQLDKDATKNEALFFLQIKRGVVESESRMIQVIRKPGFPIEFGETGIESRDLTGSIFEMVFPAEKYWKRYEEEEEFRKNLDQAYQYIEELHFRSITQPKNKCKPETDHRILN